jgi:succinate-semialdehyde dehydrogenase/glutarate-semialdehyde dehydrogenase
MPISGKGKTDMQLKNTSLLRQQSLINGQWLDASGGQTFSVTNPATGEVIARVADMDATAAKQAIEAAHERLQSWRKTSAKERSKLLRNWYNLIMANQEDLALLMTAEQGKPLAESRGEVAYGANYVEWFAEEAKRAYGRVIPAPSPDKRLLVTKEPVGVCALITPWNFPNAMITRKVAPALAAGCTVVIKPPQLTPLSALALGVLATEAGIPAGVINIITTKNSRAIGTEFTTHPLVRKISFTGSTEVGKTLMAQCASTVKKVSLELGGNAPFIVFDDANLDAAIKGLMASKYRNTGQTCVCTNRVLVQEGIYDAFVKKLVEATAALKVGNGLQEGIEQGPLIDENAVKGVEILIADALEKGAKILTGGKRHSLGHTFFEPTVISGVTAQMRFAKEEIFGPVSPVFRFKTEAEAIRMANDTEFGLAAYFYAQNNARVWRVMEQLEYGMVGINEGLLSTELAPFGGIKESGIGREGGIEGLEEYMETKYTCIGGLGA